MPIHPGDTPDDALALIQAATLAAPHDAAASAHLLSRALERIPDGASVRRSLVLQLLPVSLWGGRPRYTERLAREELGSASHVDAFYLRLLIAESLGLQERWTEVLQILTELLAYPDITEEQRLRVRAQEAMSLSILRRLDEAAAVSDEVLARVEGRSVTRYIALQARCDCEFFRGHLSAAIATARELVTLAEAGSDVELRWRGPHLSLGVCLCVAGELQEAEAAFARARADVFGLGALWASSAYQWYVAYLRFRQGRWDEAVTEARAGLQAPSESEPAWEIANLLGFLACVEARRAAFDNAQRYLARFEEIPERSHGDRAWGDLARALMAEGSGDRETAYATLLALWRDGIELDVRQPLLGIAPDLLRLVLDAEDSRSAGEILDRLDAIVTDDPESAMAVATRAFARGVVEGDPDQLEEAAEIYAGRHELHRALTYEELAVRRAELGQPRKAATALRRALSRFETMGATADLHRGRARLRGREVIAPPPGAGGAPGGKWSTLTKTEWIVAELLAEGLRNQEIATRLFVSVETVQTHVKSILRKVGARSRSQVMLQLLRSREEQGSLDGPP